MEIGHIYITGPIGNTYNESGELVEKGVELIDIMEQIADFESEPQMIHCHINSPGGFVDVGEDIASFFSNRSNVVMIAENQCASIATVIHTSVPLQNRKVVAGCQYMIHNPWTDGQKGDAAQLKKVAEDLQAIENKLESHYSKATGQDKDVISIYMKKDTFLSMDQLVKFGFAAEIIQAVPQMRAVAKLRANNKNEDKMSKLSFTQRAKMSAAILSAKTPEEVQEITKNAGREVKALMIEAGDVTLETPFSDVAVGDAVMKDGAEVMDGSLDGEYTISSEGVMNVDGEVLPVGSVIVVAENKISEIKTEMAVDPAASASADKDNEETVESLKAKLAEVEAAKAEAEAKAEAVEKDAEEALKVIEEKAQMRSGYTPPRAQASFKPATKVQTGKVTAGSMKARQEQYKKK